MKAKQLKIAAIILISYIAQLIIEQINASWGIHCLLYAGMHLFVLFLSSNMNGKLISFYAIANFLGLTAMSTLAIIHSSFSYYLYFNSCGIGNVILFLEFLIIIRLASGAIHSINNRACNDNSWGLHNFWRNREADL